MSNSKNGPNCGSMPYRVGQPLGHCPYGGPHFMFPRQKFSRSENFCLGRQSFMVALNGDGSASRVRPTHLFIYNLL